MRKIIFIFISIVALFTLWNSQKSVKSLDNNKTQTTHNLNEHKPQKSHNPSEIPNIKIRNHKEKQPRSITNIEIPGPLETDPNGHLKISPNLRYLFEFFLSIEGEETFEQLSQRLRSYLTEALPHPKNVQEGMQQFADFVEMKKQLRKIAETLQELDIKTAEKLEAMGEYRRAASSAEVFTTFYEWENEYDIYTAERLRVLNDPHLRKEEKQNLLTAIEDSAPIRIRSVYERATMHLKERSLLEDNLNPKGIERLRRLDARYKNWQSRLEEFEEATQNNDPEYCNEIFKNLFSPLEQLRVRAIYRQKKIRIKLRQCLE